MPASLGMNASLNKMPASLGMKKAGLTAGSLGYWEVYASADLTLFIKKTACQAIFVVSVAAKRHAES